MKRLDGPSAQIIYADRPGQYQHTLKIAMLDFSQKPGGYNFESLRSVIERQIATIPFMRWKIRRVPLGLNHPYWVQDLNFDISHHVRRIACPAPGDRATFCQLVSELYAQTLSKSLPLWTIWMVEGLESGRIAMVTMFHHAYCDGVGAAELLRRLTSPLEHVQTSEDLGVNSVKNPSPLKLFVRGALDLPLMFMRELPYLIRGGFQRRKVIKQFKAEGKRLPPKPQDVTPSSMLTAPLGHARCFYYEPMDLARFKSVSKKLGVTINDLLLAVISGALRSFSHARGAPIDEPVIASIPLNLRNEEQMGDILGNFISSETVSMPVDVVDPQERLNTINISTSAMKDYVKQTDGVGLVSMMELLPPLMSGLLSWAVRRSEGKLTPFGNLVVSNVPGPKEHLRFLDRVEICEWLSIGQVLIGASINVTAWSYGEQFNLCLMANPAVIPDGAEFFRHIADSFDEYEKLAANAA